MFSWPSTGILAGYNICVMYSKVGKTLSENATKAFWHVRATSLFSFLVSLMRPRECVVGVLFEIYTGACAWGRVDRYHPNGMTDVPVLIAIILSAHGPFLHLLRRRIKCKWMGSVGDGWSTSDSGGVRLFESHFLPPASHRVESSVVLSCWESSFL